MVAIKFLGVFAAFYFIAIREAFAQNFYPARYGKRDENDLQTESLPEGKRTGRNEDKSPIKDRKIRFFISGGRYGKRGCFTEKCIQESKGIAIPELEHDKNQNGRILPISIRKNQFMMGSRFGKRIQGSILKGPLVKDPWCILTRDMNFYKCSTRSEPKEKEEEDENQVLQSNFLNEIPA